MKTDFVIKDPVVIDSGNMGLTFLQQIDGYFLFLFLSIFFCAPLIAFGFYFIDSLLNFSNLQFNLMLGAYGLFILVVVVPALVVIAKIIDKIDMKLNPGAR